MAITGGALLKAPKLTTRGGILAVLGVILLIVSPFAGERGLEAVASGVVLLILLMGLSMYSAVKHATIMRLRVRRILPEAIREGREYRVRVVIENPTPVPLELVEVSDNLPPTWRSQGETTVLTVPPHGSVWYEYTVIPTPGKHAIGPLTMVYRDPLGVSEARATIPLQVEVGVQPRLLDVPRRLVGVAGHSPAGSVRSRRRGLGLLFMEVREYHPEDDYRFIDWKSTARRGMPMVKVFEHEAVSNVIVALDITRTLFHGRVGRTKFEYTLRLASSLVEYMARRGYTYKLIIIPPNGQTVSTPWLRGRMSTGRGKKFIAENSPWPRNPGETVFAFSERRAAALEREILKSLGRSRTFILLISDFFEDAYSAEKYAEALSRLKALGNDVYAITPLTAVFEAQELGEAAGYYRLLAYNEIKKYDIIKSALTRRGIRMVVTGPRDLLALIIGKIEVLSA
ncbi:MAG: DUF58 domain-containing protein [Desulfurococcales archaeon]|nr:DUF58 domain-containing protein [Desulfurococcales archaeon]